MRMLVGPAGDTIANAIATKATAGIDSPAVKLLFGDWLWWWDAANETQRLVSPQAFAAGRLANLSPEQSGLNKPLYGIAGSQNVGLPGSGIARAYSAAELGALFEVGIDIVTNPGAGGQSFWTLRLGHNSSSNPAINGDNYTRLTNYIAATLAAGMGIYVGEVINTALLRNIRSTLLGFLSGLLGQGLLGSTDGTKPFAVLCDNANNPAARLALGYVQADVQIRYQGINEKFLVNLDGGASVLVEHKWRRRLRLKWQQRGWRIRQRGRQRHGWHRRHRDGRHDDAELHDGPHRHLHPGPGEYRRQRPPRPRQYNGQHPVRLVDLRDRCADKLDGRHLRQQPEQWRRTLCRLSHRTDDGRHLLRLGRDDDGTVHAVSASVAVS